jgi:chorismate mutase/prephenate dehydratase
VAELAGIRSEIDGVDAEILRLLNRRAELALAAGRAKEAAGLQSLDQDREAAVLEGLAAANRGPLSTDVLMRVYREIIRACRDIQLPPRGD